MNLKNIAITALVALVVATGVVMALGGGGGVSQLKLDVDNISDQLAKLASLGGITNYNELGLNNVAFGRVRLNSTSTSITSDTSNRIAWTNNTGKTVYVPIRSLDIMLTPDTSNGRSTSSAYRVFVGTSTSETSTTPIGDYEPPASTVGMLVRGMFFGSSSVATSSNALIYSLHYASSTGHEVSYNNPTNPLATTSRNVVSNLIVANGEVVQVVLQQAYGHRNCGDTVTPFTPRLCETSTSTGRGFTLQAYFEYFMHDDNQPEP